MSSLKRQQEALEDCRRLRRVGKAIIILNPADSLQFLMRNTVYVEAAGIDADDAATAIPRRGQDRSGLTFLATASGKLHR